LESAGLVGIDELQAGLGLGPAGGLEANFGDAEHPLEDVSRDVDVLYPGERDLATGPGDHPRPDVEAVVGQFVLEPAVVGGLVCEHGEPDAHHREHH
jgi:hypothetical protein